MRTHFIINIMQPFNSSHLVYLDKVLKHQNVFYGPVDSKHVGYIVLIYATEEN